MPKQILGGSYEYGTPICMLFIDLKAAYDTVNRNKFIEMMK